jgi:hypothetical protein
MPPPQVAGIVLSAVDDAKCTWVQSFGRTVGGDTTLKVFHGRLYHITWALHFKDLKISWDFEFTSKSGNCQDFSHFFFVNFSCIVGSFISFFAWTWRFDILVNTFVFVITYWCLLHVVMLHLCDIDGISSWFQETYLTLPLLAHYEFLQRSHVFSEGRIKKFKMLFQLSRFWGQWHFSLNIFSVSVNV